MRPTKGVTQDDTHESLGRRIETNETELVCLHRYEQYTCKKRPSSLQYHQ